MARNLRSLRDSWKGHRVLNFRTAEIPILILLFASLSLIPNSVHACLGTNRSYPVTAGNRHPENIQIDYTHYERVLSGFVNDRGMVDYHQLKNSRSELDQFMNALDNLEPSTYQDWDQAEQLSFWINAYNAITLKTVIDHYPIQAGFLKSLVYPRNSIRQIPGVWDTLEFSVLGRKLTLNEIEHEIIRKDFREPRIHLALVCASNGCPPLRDEPYRGAQIDVQLDDQVHRFLSDPENFRIVRKQNRIYLSSIFDWFRQDFAETYSVEMGFSGGKKSERPVLKFISMYLDAQDVQYLQEGKYRIEYIEYDWSLNEQ